MDTSVIARSPVSGRVLWAPSENLPGQLFHGLVTTTTLHPARQVMRGWRLQRAMRDGLIDSKAAPATGLQRPGAGARRDSGVRAPPAARTARRSRRARPA